MEDIEHKEFRCSSVFDEEQQLFKQVSIPENDLGETQKFNEALKMLTEEYDMTPKEEKKKIEKKIDRAIIEFFEENRGKEDIHIIAPSRTCVCPRIAYYFEKVFLQTFDFISDEKAGDIGLVIEEELKNIVGYRNPKHKNHTFYFHSLIDKEKNSCQFIDFNSGNIPERTMEVIRSNDKSKIHEDMERISEGLEEHGWGTEIIGYACDYFDCQPLIINGKKRGHITDIDIKLK